MGPEPGQPLEGDLALPTLTNGELKSGEETPQEQVQQESKPSEGQR
jgi:hypothetical protein